MNNWRTYTVLFFTILFIGSATGLSAQKKQADKFFEQREYGKALKMYNLYDKIDKRKNTLMRRAICHYHENNMRKCIKDLSNAHGQGYNRPDFYKYMSMALHDSEEFEDAAIFYKRYLNKLDRDNPERLKVIHTIKQCGYARNARYKPQLGYVENVGTFINTKGDELTPIESPNYNNKLYFTSQRKGYDIEDVENDLDGNYSSKDIYGSTQVNGIWNDVEGIGLDINSASNEIILDFSSEGKVLYFMSDMSESRMSILVDTFSENSAPNKFVSPISPTKGDRDVIVYSDSIFIFSSNGRGGLGGYDLFMTRLDKNFYWSEPINLGSQINSIYNERSPYISRNGIRMFFSSDRKESFGGYDVFKTDFNRKTLKWQTPENVGIPINSPKNDLSFRLTKSGKSVFFSSNRSSGEGGYDIYTAYLNTTDESQLKLNAELSFYEYYMNILEFKNEKIFQTQEEYTQQIPSSTEIEIQQSNTEIIVDPILDAPVVEKNVILVNPLYYDDDDDVRSTKNTETIREIGRAYRQDPRIKIVLVSHSLAENFPEFDLYLSGKRGEKIIKAFENEGIPKEAIILVGVGSNYPLMKEMSDGQRLKLSSTINRRIDIFPLVEMNSSVDLKVTEPSIGLGLKDARFESFVETTSGLHYRVKVKEDSKMIDTGFISPFSDLIAEKRGKNFLYTVGLFNSFDEALERYNELLQRNVSDIKIIPFIDFKEVEKGSLSKYLRKYPDLLNFLKFEQ